ncbi:VCBS repeat-containing protein [Flavobacteriaceae bacterium]|jgi:hypothetical protein|nr:VCBS repeat-containing protein [Flavobacteriaceae bacterium]
MLSNKINYFFYIIILILFFSCERISNNDQIIFELLSTDTTGIDFENSLSYSDEFNIYKYRNFYNGGGVGLGDVNNDGLLDIYLTANQLSNRLYINKGDFVFEDVTKTAKIGGNRAWSTGVAMVDINSDGWLDIYVCNSGDVNGDNKQNEFFINNKDGTFSEKAKEMGLADTGLSTHASFFDYDKDGDLDVYLLNNSFTAIGSFNLQKNQRGVRDKKGGDKLFRNDAGKFIDVTEKAGIYGSEIGFGLGVSVADLNKDGWLDLYISNDFFERDYIYMNNGDGTFSEDLENQMRSTSLSSMGSDIADITGDGYPEIFVTEMLPENDERYKTTMTFENWDKYQYNIKNGYYHQFTRNMLHRNNGISFGDKLTFSEVGRLAGVEATDWSWSALITDFDNNGHKDLFVANGLAQDILDQDYLKYISSEEITKMVVTERGVDYKKLIDIIPITKISNYAYSGDTSLGFKDVTEYWGLDMPSHSNGAAYGDLDNDGDLDLIVNNVNMPSFIYKNRSRELLKENNYLKVKLIGEKMNLNAFGAKVTIKSNEQIFYLEQSPNRGFQSSVDNIMNFGLGKISNIDSLIVDWYYGKRTVLTNISVNQTLVLNEASAEKFSSMEKVKNSKPSIFKNISDKINIDYKHNENIHVDFDRDRLLNHMKSTEGPKIDVGDVNDDGLMDFYIGGAKNSAGKLFLNVGQNKFKSSNEDLFEKDKQSEDSQVIFFDADNDEDLDLYVSSGGVEYFSASFDLFDRLYINDGFGEFTKSSQLLPSSNPESTSVVLPNDFDKDGDLDLFVGIRLKPGSIGVPQNGYILENDGKGKFKDVTLELAPEMIGLGMITDAKWADFDNDNDNDLIIVGEWMGIKLFENDNSKFYEISKDIGLKNTSGWWNRIVSSDIDDDGDIDFIVGNHGLNSRFKASVDEPISCYINDFDNNGSIEQIVCNYNQGKSYPLVLRHDLIKQLPHLKKKYVNYSQYKGQTIKDLFTDKELEGSIVHEVTMLESVILLNNGEGSFSIKQLPEETQLSPIYAILASDLDKDGNVDLILGGNLHKVKPEIGRYDASYGQFLKGLGNGNFGVSNMDESGLILNGEIRDFKILNQKQNNLLLVARNNSTMEFYQY